jgi:DJ-1 family protein
MPHVLVPISNGTEEMEAVIIIDMLRRAGITVTVAGDGDVIICSRGVKLVPDAILETLTDDDQFDAIVLPGGMQGVESLSANESVVQILERHIASKRLVAAICAAPLVLHDHALIPKGATITSHPSVAAGTAFEFSLALIRRLTSDAVATRVATDIVLYE